MTSLARVARAMQAVLTSAADSAAHTARFVQRRSKLGGALFVQTLVFGWLGNPQATLDELAQTAATLGLTISPQGLDGRFSPQAAELVRQVLETAVHTLVTTDPVAIPLLARFNGVYLHDSSVVALPEALADLWPGSGGSAAAATLKLGVRLDLARGALLGPVLLPGRSHDTRLPLQAADLPPGALRLADLGFFNLAALRDLDQRGVYWLSRYQAGPAAFDLAGQRRDIVALLEAQGADAIDLPIVLGVAEGLPARLLAVRVPQEVADQRRRKLREDARRRQQAVSRVRLALAEWTVFVTNVPAGLLSLREALVLGRARWQIELLFKLWKSHGGIDESRSAKPWRVLCEVYAKLLAMVVQHWVLVAGCWAYPDRSLVKAAQTVRKHALAVASVFGSPRRLLLALRVVVRCLASGCRLNRRRARPNTYQRLLDPSEGGIA
ncbi:MAG TPA: IS4 family transposase [Chloroflexota bacterium]|nr:IS4 family transposase [Chloroflexota bacterium]